MHLLFDMALTRSLGEAHVRDGAVHGLTLTREGEQVFALFWPQWQTDGIRVLRSAGSDTGAVAFEMIPLNASNAFKAFVNASLNNGFVVITLDARQSAYWNELQGWPMLEATRTRMAVLLRNIGEQDTSAWDVAWSALKREMEKQTV